MESNPQTSFIPKRPLTPGAGKAPRTTNVFSIIATVIFVTIVLVCVAAGGYTYYLNHSISTSKTNLQTVLAKFEPSLIAELSRVDARIESAKTLMNQHVAFSGFFDYLSQATLQNVQFTSFSYTQKDRAGSVSLAGSAHSFASVALQAAEMMKPENQKYLQDPVFSSFNLDDSGNVNFSVTGSVNSSTLLYRNTLNATSSATTN